MTALLHILLCFEFVPPSNLLFFTYVFVLPRPPPFFAGYELPSSIFFFLVGKFLSDIWSGRLAFFVRHYEKMSDCSTSPTNFDSTAGVTINVIFDSKYITGGYRFIIGRF